MAIEAGRAPPQVGGRFHVTDILGEGGTATVFLAWDAQQGQWCALKALHHRHLGDFEMRKRFTHEAEALRLLRHPHVIELLLHEDDATPPFSALELARGGSVMDRVKERGPLPAPTAARLIREVCDALDYAHEQGIIHRDVKPHNFLLDERGVCKLTDFGIARMHDHTSLTQTGSQIGTFSFMAPEQRQDAKSVDTRADIYSVGASLYTMLTARTSAELFVADKDDELLAELPTRFREVVLRATRYRPDERYATMALLGEAVVRAAGREVEEPFDPPPPLPAGPPRVVVLDRRFDDLLRSLALTPEEPTYAPAPDRLAVEVDSPRKVMPYYMPSRPRTPGRPADVIPDYVDDSDRNTLVRQHEAQRARAEAEQLQQAREAEEKKVEAEQMQQAISDWRPWLLLLTLIPPLVAALILGVTLTVGTMQVGAARRETLSAGDRLVGVLRDESSVVYQLGGDRTVFERLWSQYQQAPDDDRLLLAVQFVEAVERAAEPGAPESVTLKVRRLQEARNQYLEAHGRWEARAHSFPGVIVVVIGLSSGP
jgi:serine/threonine protein kinase